MRLRLLALHVFLAAACGGPSISEDPPDSGTADGGRDGGFADAGATDGGAIDAGLTDAGPTHFATLTVDRSAASADGADVIGLTIQVQQTDGGPIPGASVLVEVTGTANALVVAPTTDLTGTSVGTLRSTRAEAKAVIVLVQVDGGPALAPPAQTVTFHPGAAVALVFLSQPDAGVSTRILEPFVLAAVDSSGNVVDGGEPFDVILTLEPVDGGVPVAALVDAGLPHAFTDLVIGRAGSYTLTASSSGLTPGRSGPFEVSAGPAYAAAFDWLPGTIISEQPISPPVVVEYRDDAGNTVPDFGTFILTLHGGAAGVPLDGTTTQPTVDGRATFADLSIAPAGDYFFEASGGGLGVAPPRSAIFTVQPGEPYAPNCELVASPKIGFADDGGILATFTARDRFGNLVPGARVLFGIDAGEGALSELDAGFTDDAGVTGLRVANLPKGYQELIGIAGQAQRSTVVGFRSHGCDVQNFVLFVGGTGTAGALQLLFPQPDPYSSGPGSRLSAELPAHFLQDAGSGGRGDPLSGTLANTLDYTSPPARPGWLAGERFKRVYGADNMAFRGFTSHDPGSQGLDQLDHGSSFVPSNVTVTADGGLLRRDPSLNWLVASRETPWISKYGMKKAITALEGGLVSPSHIPGALHHRPSNESGWSIAAYVTALHAQVVPSLTPGIVVGDLSGPYGGTLEFFASDGGVPQAFLPRFVANDAPAFRDAMGLHPDAGVNIVSLLSVSPSDRTRYGFTGTTPASWDTFRDELIIAAKGMSLGATGMVVLPLPSFDGHDAFTSAGTNGITAATYATFLSNTLGAFMDDLMVVQDPFCPATRLGDRTVIAFVGDTPRSSVSRTGWGDAPSSGQNRTWVMSNGLLRTGFFGGERPRFPGEGANPPPQPGPGEAGLYSLSTGDLLPFDPGGQGLIGGADLRERYGEYAMRAILYALVGQNEVELDQWVPGPHPRVTWVPPLR